MPGSLLEFLHGLQLPEAKLNGDTLGTMPPTEGIDAGRVVDPMKVIRDKENAKDPNVIYNDQGDAVDYSNGNPFSKLLKGGTNAPQGTLRNFLGRMLGTGNPTDVGSATEMTGPSKNIDTANLSPTPMQDQGQVNLQPKKDYGVPSALPPAALSPLRDSLLTGAGLNPAEYADTSDANGLAGRMNSPNSKAEMRGQAQEAQNISQQFRGAGVSGPVERAKLPTIGSNTSKKSDKMNTNVQIGE